MIMINNLNDIYCDFRIKKKTKKEKHSYMQ